MNHRGSASVPAMKPVSHWQSIIGSSSTVFIKAGRRLWRGWMNEWTAGKFALKWAHYRADFQSEPFRSACRETLGAARWRKDEGCREELIPGWRRRWRCGFDERTQYLLLIVVELVVLWIKLVLLRGPCNEAATSPSSYFCQFFKLHDHSVYKV